jgi:serine/threonine protein kinase
MLGWIREYGLRREVYNGDMSTIFAACKTTGPDVALKRNKTAITASSLSLAAAISSCAHPNILPPIDFFVQRYQRDEVLIEVMPLVQWPTLEQVQIADSTAAAHIALQLASALEVLHGKDVVHGDVQPRNIFMVDDRPVIFDFNTSQFRDSNRNVRVAYDIFAVARTLEYMLLRVDGSRPGSVPRSLFDIAQEYGVLYSGRSHPRMRGFITKVGKYLGDTA